MSRSRRLLTDPTTGILTDLAEKRYRPSAGLDRAVRARDVTCRFPGCRRSADSAGTDLDHTVPWPQGPTAAANLAVLCRRHHRLKHTPGWNAELDPTGDHDLDHPHRPEVSHPALALHRPRPDTHCHRPDHHSANNPRHRVESEPTPTPTPTNSAAPQSTHAPDLDEPSGHAVARGVQVARSGTSRKYSSDSGFASASLLRTSRP